MSFGDLKKQKKRPFNPLKSPSSFDDIFSHRDWSFDANIGLAIVNAFERIVNRPQGSVSEGGSWKHIDWRTIPESLKVKEEEIIDLAEQLHKLGLSDSQIVEKLVEEVIDLPLAETSASESMVEPTNTSETTRPLTRGAQRLAEKLARGPLQIKENIKNRVEKTRALISGVAEKMPGKIEQVLDELDDLPEMTSIF